MKKNIILFITVAMIFVTGTMSASAVPLGIIAPPGITSDATSSLTTHVANLGTPTIIGGASDTIVTNNAPSGNNFPLGATTVVWTVSNAAVVATDTQVVTIKDMTGPTITMAGPSTVTVVVGNVYTDAGATAKDIVDGDVTAKIQVFNNVNAGMVNTYYVTYDVSDNAGNKATQKIRTVNIVATPTDNIPPVITIVGTNPVTITVGTVYADKGATALDNVDGDITAKIQYVNDVDTNVAGTYHVTYDVSDNAGNVATQKIRTVIVGAVPTTDTIPPTIVPSSSVTMEATGIKTSVTLVSPVVTDNVDTSPTVTNDMPAGGFPVGPNVVTWKACDHATPTPNCGTAAQSVTIIDTKPPSIIPPPDVNIRATGSVTHVTLGNATASDLVDPSPVITKYAPAGNSFPVGDTTVMWKACDHAVPTPNCNTATQLVTVLPQGAIILAHNPPLSINRTAPSTVEFNVTTDQAVNVIWSLDGVNVTGNNSYSTTYASYSNTIYTIGNHIVSAYIENGNTSYYKSWSWSVKGGLKISANIPSVYVGKPTDVIFTVTRKCGIESADNSSCVGTVIPVIGASVSLAGVSNGTGVTGTNGQTNISVNATGVGTITATVSYSSTYNDDTTNITAGVQSSTGSGSSGGDSGNSGGGGGGGGVGTAEPYDNILKFERQENGVFTTPVSFKYTIPELGIYNVWITSLQSNIAILRLEVLKGTSKLVGSPAPGIVYKNINGWIDYKRIKNATIQFKVENSWIDSNSLVAEKVKMSMWDNTSRRWIELPTTMTSKDGSYTYFDAQTTTFSSFAISGSKPLPTVTVGTPSATVTEGSVDISPEPIVTGAVASKGSRNLQIGIVAIVVVLIVYVLRLKKN